MHLLHLGAHRLNAAQDLVLVRDGSDADPCQVSVESKRRSRGLRNVDQTLAQGKKILSQPQAAQQKQGRCTEMFN